MFSLGALSVPITGLGGTSVISMTATIFGCFMLAIVMFMLLAQKPKAPELPTETPDNKPFGLLFSAEALALAHDSHCAVRLPT